MDTAAGRAVARRLSLAAEIVATYCLARWWLFRLPVPTAVEVARTPTVTRLQHELAIAEAAQRLGRSVERTLRLLPFDTRCLIRALVLTRLLSRRGIASTFVLGVRAKPEFAAHAWVERGGVALLPTGHEFHRLREL